jgi:hypothetical protein
MVSMSLDVPSFIHIFHAQIIPILRYFYGFGIEKRLKSFLCDYSWKYVFPREKKRKRLWKQQNSGKYAKDRSTLVLGTPSTTMLGP